MSTAGSDQFSIGRVVGRTFSTVGGNLVPFAMIAVLLVAAPRALSAWIQLQIAGLGGATSLGQIATTAPAPASPAGGLAYGIALIFFALLSVALSATAQGAIIYGVVADLSGKKAGVGEMLTHGWKHWWKLFLINLCTVIMAFLGAIALFVPGIMLLIRWSAAVPAEIMESKGVFGSMGRSAELTKGRRWAIFGLGLVVVIIIFIVELVVAAVVLPGGNFIRDLNLPLFQYLIAPLISVVTTPLAMAGTASLYFELRSTREGVGVEKLASVFD